MEHKESVQQLKEQVQSYYGDTLQQSTDLLTNACCVTGAPPPWLNTLLQNIHPEVLDQFYGCGFPIPEAIEGATVVDLGCGTGRDVFLLSQLVGATGQVHGIDMTPSQLVVAQKTVEWHTEKFGLTQPNVHFHQSDIEDLSALDLPSNSVDVIVSNCVVNLSPNKDKVLSEVYRLLKPGGEFYFSDVFADRRLPKDVSEDPILYAECLGGAMYGQDFMDLAKATGFLDPRVISQDIITIENDALAQRVGSARFYSVTLRLFKLPSLETRCEDYGQIAIYQGTVPHIGPLFTLDAHHLFEANRPERVCGNTAEMLESTRYGDHFKVIGDRKIHYGEFVCGDTLAAQQYRDTSTNTSSGACC